MFKIWKFHFGNLAEHRSLQRQTHSVWTGPGSDCQSAVSNILKWSHTVSFQQSQFTGQPISYMYVVFVLPRVPSLFCSSDVERKRNNEILWKNKKNNLLLWTKNSKLNSLNAIVASFCYKTHHWTIDLVTIWRHICFENVKC